MVNDTILEMEKRTQIQIDCSPELRQKIRVLALQEGVTLRSAVLLALAEKYPELKPDVKAELKKMRVEFKKL